MTKRQKYKKDWHKRNRSAILKKKKVYRKKNHEDIIKKALAYHKMYPGRHSRPIIGEEEWLIAQLSYPKNGKCQLCKKYEKKKQRLSLDHCHKTNKFRGWICDNCNIGIGKLGDNLKGLKKASLYMERFYGKL